MTIGVGAGAVVAIGSTYGTQFTISAISNAAEAVATLSASHGVTVGDYLEIRSGWGRLDKRIVRAKTVATNDVTLEGINTTSTTDYPAGAGTGTGREISGWTTINYIKQDTFSVSGGDQQFADATPLEAVTDTQIPTKRSAYNVSFAVMDTSAGLTAADTVSNLRTEAAMRISAGSSVTVANGFWSVASVPTISGSEVTTRKVDFSSSAEPKIY